ncbi:MFS transporter [Bacillus sp. DTU_2020_1000418_1_SI_GHA_SEK_038]|uniref:MFS transporter n=1 Tax=Bacillus sp. DTU_2020_1000418_1_SI_GHA_SEK_038 TaxID=3077585 RepID=UPI0028EFBDAD|nr:MFS transporter [Bacillus sp. DTU_2020_1000418_1_SI_GHA_SEK_038]WNS75430.1 MFS transporter [Bacillus sp. DTU_2020_1000418_1_SI_GHA_SEK_038]
MAKIKAWDEKHLILALLFAGWSLGNLDRFVMNYAVISITKDLQLSATSTGFLLSSFFAGYALMQIPGGWLADRYGSRKVLITAIIMWSIFTALTGAAWSLTSILIIRFLFGIGEGGYMPAGSKLIAQIFPSSERGRAMAIVLSSGAFLGILTPIFATTMMATIGWRAMFWIIGGMGIILALIFWFYIKDPKSAVYDVKEESQIQQPKSLLQLLKYPFVWSLFIASFSVNAINWGLLSWMPTYLVNVRGLELLELGWIAAIPGLSAIIGTFGAGYLLDKLPKGKEYIYGIISAACVGILLYLMFNANSVTEFMVYQTIIMIFGAFIIIFLPTNVLKTVPTQIVGSTMGFVSFGGQLAGFVTPIAIGFIVEGSKGSFDAAFWLLIGFAFICTLSFISLVVKK